MVITNIKIFVDCISTVSYHCVNTIGSIRRTIISTPCLQITNLHAPSSLALRGQSAIIHGLSSFQLLRDCLLIITNDIVEMIAGHIDIKYLNFKCKLSELHIEYSLLISRQSLSTGCDARSSELVLYLTMSISA